MGPPTLTDLAKQKDQMRRAAFAGRKAAYGAGLDARANANLLEALGKFPDANIISAYMPIRTEVSPLATMAALVTEGKRVCVPVIQSSGQALLFREWTPDAKMVEGPFGAKVPESGDYLEPEILITPLLAFDRTGARLGYGGGFYDRSFEQLRAKRPTVGVGFAYGAQEVESVPTEATDQLLDLIVTEAEIIQVSSTAH